ncbi:LysE family transporter [Candidatus Woesearchaeota archaeon]|nr:LysE family transporter [Candidatus Woesearchaeota archaeon]
MRNKKQDAFLKILKNGLSTGFILQLAVGPVFFFIVNLALQRTFLDGMAGVLAVTIVDFFYIALSILGIGKLLENKRIKKVFGIISSIVLVIFGIMIIKGASGNISIAIDTNSAGLLSSFASVFFLTLSSPLTIVLFTSIFTTKTVEYNYTKKELFVFGFGTGLATLLFMSSAVILFSLIKANVPVLLIQILNLIVGLVLIGYGGMRFAKALASSSNAGH